MNVLSVVTVLILIFTSFVATASSVREVTQSSCDAIVVNLGLGVTTQIILEQEPKVTLFADKKHFKVSTNNYSSRSLAVIPYFEQSELNMFKNSSGKLPNEKQLARALDKNYKTNLFVFFKNSNQLMFELRFVEKSKADYMLKVNQSFSKDCAI